MSTLEELSPEQHSDRITSRRTILRREYVVTRVHSMDAPVTERELATGFVATQSNERSRTTTDVHVALRHRDLPKLEASGLVSWDRVEKTVTAPADAPGTDDVASDPATLLGELDEDSENGIDGRRRRVVDALEAEDEPVDARVLARRVAADGGDSSSDAVESVLLRLHHVELPKLDADGLVEYDADDRTVVRRNL